MDYLLKSNDYFDGLYILRERVVRVENEKRLFRAVRLYHDSEAIEMFEHGILSGGVRTSNGNLELAKKNFERAFGGYSIPLVLAHTWEPLTPKSLVYGLGISTTEYLAIARTLGNYIFEIVVNDTKIVNERLNESGFHVDDEGEAYRCPRNFDLFTEYECTILNRIEPDRIRRIFKV